MPLALASEEERLRKKRFEALEPHELEQLLRLMMASSSWPPRGASRGGGGARDGASNWICAGPCARASAPAAIR